MNWLRIILDSIMMSVYFNLGTALWWLINPVAFYNDFPKEAKEKTTIPKPKKTIKPTILFCALIIVPVLFFGVLSAWNAGISGFWHLFWTGYLEWLFVNFGDFFGLDLIFREKLGNRLVLPGTEGMDVYKRSVWMKKLGLPEHFILWPIIVCPFFAIISTGLGMLIRIIF